MFAKLALVLAAGSGFAVASRNVQSSARSRMFFGSGAAPEPFQYLHGGAFSGVSVPGATDPLAQYQWTDPTLNLTTLQLYNLRPSAVVQTDGDNSSFDGIDTLLTEAPNMTISGLGTIRLDFGLENPAWFELDIEGPAGVEQSLMLGIGEMNEVYQWGHRVKSMIPVRYGSTLRLETNPQLYEGVRFAFINVNSTPAAPFRVTGLRLVCQAMPVNYSATFTGSTQLESAVWAAAVYTVRTNLEPDGFGAVLIDRGDRRAWVGDDHVAQATAMATLGGANGQVLTTLLNTSQNTNHGIESYSLYWVLSLCDYFHWSQNASLVVDMTPTLIAKLEHAASIWADPTDLQFVGWDDRLGAGFSNASTVESQIVYRFLTIHTMTYAGNTLKAAGNASLGQQYVDQAAKLFTSAVSQYSPLLSTHSAAALINACQGQNMTFCQQVAVDHLNDITQICSLSNFNQYFILNALGAVGQVAKAVQTIERCWGSEILFGGTTFFEISNPSWPTILPYASSLPGGENGPTSACHPWSSGAAPWMTKVLLGASMDEAGIVTVSPHLAGIAPGASRSGSVRLGSSGDGQVSIWVGVDANASYATVHASVRSAECQHVRIGISTTGDGDLAVDTAHAVVRIDSEVAPALAQLTGSNSIDTVPGIVVSARTVCLREGQHMSLRVPLRPISLQPEPTQSLLRVQSEPFPPGQYPATFIGNDTTTKGNWLGKYGSKGYALLSFVDTNTDLVSLPPGITSIAPVYRFDRACWTTNSTDPRALQHPDGADKPRGVGAIASEFGGNPTVAIEISGEASEMPEKGYTVSLYVVDWDQRGRRQGIAPLTGYPALQPASEHVYMPEGETFVNGVWFTWKMPAGSARFRFNWIRGDNAVVSAIVFD